MLMVAGVIENVVDRTNAAAVAIVIERVIIIEIVLIVMKKTKITMCGR